jgi:hypothetical protein
MSLPSYRYPPADRPNPAFDGAGFVRSWNRFVGSVHRHYQTGELVLFWSSNGPHPEERERLRQTIEADPRNIASVLCAVDQRAEAWNSLFVTQATRRA